MNPHEQALGYPFGDRLPAPAEPLEVAPGVRWLRMPLPFQLDHINLWLLQDSIDGRDGWTLVDTGVSNDATRALWDTVIARHLQGLPVLRVLGTHMHPDHIGLARMLCDRFDVPLWMTVGEYAMARFSSAPVPGVDRDAYAHYRRHGMTDGPALQALCERAASHFPSLVPSMPVAFRRIAHGDEVAIGGRAWRVIGGRGHSPEHASLYCAESRLLISGDMVLPRISTNVSVWYGEPEADPLAWYLASLRAFAPCAPDTLVLPSHGRPFTGLHERLSQLQAHHDDRLGRVLQACARGPLDGAGAIPVVFGRTFDTHQTMFALGEAIAHLHLPWYDGRLRRTKGADGVFRFEAA